MWAISLSLSVSLSLSLYLSPEGLRHWFGVPQCADCMWTGACLACNQKGETEPCELNSRNGRKTCLIVAAAMHVKHNRDPQYRQCNGVKLYPGMAPK